MISFFDEDSVKSKLKNKRKLKTWIKSIIVSYGKTVGDISFIFVSDPRILEINQQYLQHDYYTDVITFDYVEEDSISGDIFISVDTVASNSTLYNTTYIAELHRVIIHGVLHLCGLKDKTKTAERQMRQAENQALKLLKEML